MQAFEQFLFDLAHREIQEGELLSIFVVGEDFKQTAEPVFERCNPGRGAGKSELTSNPERTERLFLENFANPIISVKDKLVTQVPATYSPIFEMIQIVSINGFRKASVNGSKRLIVVSDMLQNTPEFSYYRGEIDFPVLREKPWFLRMRTDLSGVNVDLIYLMHTPHLQNRRNVKFWEDYFRDMKATVRSVQPLEG
jgi:hypothetical protein